MSTALNAARAAVEAAQAARNAPLKPRAKGVSADLVTDADAAAEQAAVAVIRTDRPDDAILGEEGANRAGTSARRWLVDGIDGTVAFAAGLRGGWCSAVALEDEHGPLVAAVHDPLGDTYAAARGEGATLNGEPIHLGAARPLETAHVATFLRQDRLVRPGVRQTRPRAARPHRAVAPRRPGLARARLGRRGPPRRLGPAGDRSVGLAARCAPRHRGRRGRQSDRGRDALARRRTVSAG